MPAFMKEYYGDPKHPEYKRFIALAAEGCPRCRNGRLYQKGAWPIGLVMCGEAQNCCYVYQYDGNGGWVIGEDGRAGNYCEDYQFPTRKKKFLAELKERQERAIYNRKYDI